MERRGVGHGSDNGEVRGEEEEEGGWKGGRGDVQRRRNSSEQFK